MTHDEIETALQEKGKTAPRLTMDAIEAQVVSAQFHVFPGTTTTVCCLTLQNGFTVIGQSACVVPATFDAEIGRAIARQRATQEIWQLEGYALANSLTA